MEQAYISEKQLAAYWNITPKTLQRWRNEGRGPRYAKIGKCIRYLPSDAAIFEVFVATSAHRQATSSAEPPTVLTEEDLTPAQLDTLLRIRRFLHTKA